MRNAHVIYRYFLMNDKKQISVKFKVMILQYKSIFQDAMLARFLLDNKFQWQEGLWPSGLDNYIACNSFAKPALFWPLEFAIRNKSQARHHWNLKLDTKLKYNNTIHLISAWDKQSKVF